MAINPFVTFRALPELADALTSRGREGESLGGIARDQLERYFECLRRTLATVQLSEAEASLIADAGNGVLWEAHTVPLLWAQVADAIQDEGLDRKWGVNGAALVERLRGLNYAQALAVTDAITRYWREPNPIDEALRRVGLVQPAPHK
jgi:hypothetical protein